MDFRDVQLENAFIPIEVTLLGSVMDFRDVQLENASIPIEVTLNSVVLSPIL